MASSSAASSSLNYLLTLFSRIKVYKICFIIDIDVCETEDCKEMCKKISACVECIFFKTGPFLTVSEKPPTNCMGCDFIDAVYTENILVGDSDPSEAQMTNNGTCLIEDDAGCKFTFSYGYEDEAEESIKVWTDKSQRKCLPSEVISLNTRYML